MKKLGIITFNRALNYGAILQAYAMKSVCESLGYETYIIDYNKGDDSGPHPVRTFCRAANKKRAIIKLLKSILSYYWFRKRWKSFKRFRLEYLNETEPCETAAQISDLDYEAYIMGSDQIWNYNITGCRFDPVYFGMLPRDAVSVVYGASAHDTPFPFDMEMRLKECLAKTNAVIGIREQQLADYVGVLTDIEYPVVIDPTLLAGKEALEKIEGDWSPSGPYILIYQIDHNPYSDISIHSLEKRFGCRVYSMTVPKLGSAYGKKGSAGPKEFLSILEHASFLVTNSFHGVALSLLWHKQFYVYENVGVMTRIDGLLNSLELEGRKVRMVADINPDNKIDYSVVDNKLNKMRADSLAFLKKALQGDRQVSIYEKRGDKNFDNMLERSKQNCSGCTACVDICPVNAIEMMRDQEGFLYPEINQKTCIHCGACDTFCSFYPCLRRDKDNLPEAYGVKHKVQQTRRSSRSGGAFVAVSDVILRRSGIVYGAAILDNCEVRHIRAVSAGERDLLKGAKYVQSNISGIFDQIISDLYSGKEVLFSGTPCQVAGLKELLERKRIDSSKLLTCDLVCHGVPSPQIWTEYCQYIEKKYRAKIVKADFRDKSFGWDTHYESFVLDNGKKIVRRDYTDLFYDHIMFRPSCYNCQFSNINRVGDITLADFWGVEKSDPSFADAMGVSLVLINSEKGREVFTEARKDLECIKCDLGKCLQPTLIKPSAASPRREMFWKSYQDRGFAITLKEYVKPISTIKRLKRYSKQILYRLRIRPHP